MAWEVPTHGCEIWLVEQGDRRMMMKDKAMAAPSQTSSCFFELHGHCSPADLGVAEFCPEKMAKGFDRRPSNVLQPFSISMGESFVRVRVDERSGELQRVAELSESSVVFSVIGDSQSRHLGMTALHDGVLVNGLPALPFSILASRDVIKLGPSLFYLTERFTPHVGPPTVKMLGRQCRFDKIPVDEKTWVVSCWCGEVYHHETDGTHPSLPDEERLDCLSKIKKCQTCGRKLTTVPYLTWDPETL